MWAVKPINRINFFALATLEIYEQNEVEMQRVMHKKELYIEELEEEIEAVRAQRSQFMEELRIWNKLLDTEYAIQAR